MRVRYFIEIIELLIAKGASQLEISKSLGFTKQNMTEILGKDPKKQRQNLKDEHLPGLVRLCRKYGLEPKNGNALIRLIEREKKAKGH